MKDNKNRYRQKGYSDKKDKYYGASNRRYGRDLLRVIEGLRR